MKQEVENKQAELLPPEGMPDKDQEYAIDVKPLSFATPLEQWKNLFDRMAGMRQQILVWEENTQIIDNKTRDEAILFRTTVTKTAKAIEEAYLELTEEARAYIKEVRGYATQAQIALIGDKNNPKLGVSGRLTEKISAWAEEQKRLEEEMKRKALADLKFKQDEIEAWETEAKYREEAKRVAEDLALQQLRDKALADAQAAGHTETDELAADYALEEAQAKIDAERAERERKDEETRIANEKALSEQESKTAVTLAVATGLGQTKGVKRINVIELLDENLLPRNVLSYDSSKAKKWVDGGFYGNEKDPLKIIPGCRVTFPLGKGGR